MNQLSHNVKRVYHPWWNWECYKFGFFETTAPNDLSPDDAREAYRSFLADTGLFAKNIERVFKEWPNSCEHNLTNPSINRIAWIGQSAMCIYSKVPAVFRGGFKLLTEEQQQAADKTAEIYLNKWLSEYAAKSQ